jgi:hypothetical protein
MEKPRGLICCRQAVKNMYLFKNALRSSDYIASSGRELFGIYKIETDVCMHAPYRV